MRKGMPGVVALRDGERGDSIVDEAREVFRRQAAAIGALGQTEPAWALALSVVVPVLLWLVARRWLRR